MARSASRAILSAPICDPHVTTSRVAFALDYPSYEEADRALSLVASEIGMAKVGLELFTREGPRVVALGGRHSLPVFLDLKLHDISETVERAVRSVAHLGARYLTVHASGGPKMLERAVAAAGDSLSICAVTILTSLSDADLGAIGMNGPTGPRALSLAKLAYSAGVRAFVCSPREAGALRAELGPEATLITPGVRAPEGAKGDQQRTATPFDAVRDGADWIVVGRPIRDAIDPCAAAKTFRSEADRGYNARS